MPEFRDRGKYLPAYQQYLERLPMNVLQCRIYGHKYPDLHEELKKGSKSRAKVRKSRIGNVSIQIECLRKCGTSIYRFRTFDGYVDRPNRVIHEDKNAILMSERREYDYDNPTYLVPPEARSGHGLTKEMNAMARAEELTRLTEWITEE
jgi:hypothetical protein